MKSDVTEIGGQLTGVAARFNTVVTTCNRHGKPNRPATIRRDAFRRALQEAANIQLLIGHDPRRVVCDTKNGLFLEVRGDKLLFTAWPWKTRDGYAAWFGVQAGRFTGMSFGAAVTIHYRGATQERWHLPAVPVVGSYIIGPDGERRLWEVSAVVFDGSGVDVFALEVSPRLADELTAAWAAWGEVTMVADEANPTERPTRGRGAG